MSPRYLLDTNIWSAALSPVPPGALLGELERNAAEVATAALVLHEVRYGVLRLPAGKRRRALERAISELFADVPVLPYDAAAAEWHARERVRLAARGRTRPFVDGQIAAIAVVNGCTLVTRNGDDFTAWRSLDVVDWTR